jgi:hypothetical protein
MRATPTEQRNRKKKRKRRRICLELAVPAEELLDVGLVELDLRRFADLAPERRIQLGSRDLPVNGNWPIK